MSLAPSGAFAGSVIFELLRGGFVYSLDVSAIINWGQLNSQARPQSIRTYCPHCSERAVFVVPPDVWFWDAPRKTLVASARCPSCGDVVYFWAVNAHSDTRTEREPEYLVMYPVPRSTREPIEGMDKVPERIRRAYLEALGAYNARLWGAATTSSRRTLEGIVGGLVPGASPSDSLAGKIRELGNSVDLSKPLIDLSDAVRHGGNIDAHFDEDREADEELARSALDLIEYLMEYVYTLPGMVSDLNARINPPPPAPLSTSPGS